MKYFISIAIFMFISSFAGVRAQNDPTLAGMILMYTNKACLLYTSDAADEL